MATIQRTGECFNKSQWLNGGSPWTNNVHVADKILKKEAKSRHDACSFASFTIYDSYEDCITVIFYHVMKEFDVLCQIKKIEDDILMWHFYNGLQLYISLD